MRKILAVLLACLFIVSALAMLPAAAEDAKVSSFDGSTSDQTFDLIVTEFFYATTPDGTGFNSEDVNGNGRLKSNGRCYQYIEIYNNGTDAVNLYDLAILRVEDKLGKNSIWQKNKNFTEEGRKITIQPGNIYNGVQGATEDKTKNCDVRNPQTAILEPGEFAIVWFWSGASAEISQMNKESLAVTKTGRAAFPNFRDYYAKLNNIQMYVGNNPANGFTPDGQALENVLIVAVCGNSAFQTTASGNATKECFDLVNGNYLFALANKSFNLDMKDLSADGQEIYCYFSQSINGRHGITANVDNLSSIYVPTNATPDLHNAVTKIELTEAQLAAWQDKTDYVEVGSSYSYKELGLMSFAETPSLGSMPSYQWAYINPTAMEDAVANGKTYMVSDWATNSAIKNADGTLAADWAEKTIAALIAERAVQPEDTTSGREEEFNDAFNDLRDQGAWDEQKNSNVKPTTSQKKSFPTWALIAIIAGSVVVVAGVAVTVILVVKSKKRKA